MKVLIVVISLFCCFLVKAQYISKLIAFGESSQFYNPATTGADECLSAMIGTKIQWVGLDGAPTTNYFLVNTILKDRRMGLGVGLVNDRIGLYTNNSLRFSYAYRMVIEKGILALGLNAGFQHLTYRFDQLSIINKMDPVYVYNNVNRWSPQFGVGLLYTRGGLKVGLSMPSIVNGISPSNMVSQIGYLTKLSDLHSVGADVIYKTESNNNRSQIEFGAKYVFDDKILFGLGARQYGEFILSFGYKPSKKWIIVYGYDFISGNLKGRFAGSHEILLKYKLVEHIKSSSPRHF
ncbi:MAG: type IX secretion system PorP/SprF family membrane protein [Flavobacteriales bacterium]